MIFFDSAATTFQKPPQVRRAVLRAMEEMSSPGRGGYRQAAAAAETVYACRQELAELFHVADPERVVFTMNATHGLNIAIHSLLSEGGHAVISGYEHNAVTRPLGSISAAEVTVAEAPLFSPERTLEAFSSAIRRDTRAVICTHVSNVFGDVLPVEELAALCREKGVPLLIDASQSAGSLPLDFDGLGAAFAAMPGHKGLYGPQGTGVLLCQSAEIAKPLLHGGTGSFSREPAMPEELPERLEAGTHNVPGIAGLRQGVRFVRELGPARIHAHERLLLHSAAEGLQRIRGVRVFAAAEERRQYSVLSFTVEGLPGEEVARRLARRGVCVRAGLHCAPLAHRSGGTLEDGTVRLSFSAFNTQAEVMNFLKIMREISG
ncbi:MAG: aminotransferase class V-fold PLP-dependent enzyme [Oscillospiraceae bacterium]